MLCGAYSALWGIQYFAVGLTVSKNGLHCASSSVTMVTLTPSFKWKERTKQSGMQVICRLLADKSQYMNCKNLKDFVLGFLKNSGKNQGLNVIEKHLSGLQNSDTM